MTTAIEKFDQFEQAATLHLKGYSYAEIGRELNITPVMAKSFIGEYKQFVIDRAQSDPHLLDRLQENTLEMLDEVALLAKEAWKIFEEAKNFQAQAVQLNALKLAGEFTDKKAKLLQLMGARTDSSAMARMQKAEQVNAIVSRVIKEVVSQCPKCRVDAQHQLAEAFRIMQEQEQVTDPEPIEDEAF